MMFPYATIVFWGVGSAVLALIGLFIAKKILKPIDLKENGELLLAMVTIIGTLVSILLGLLVSSSVDDYHSLEASVNFEATSVSEIFRYARGLPEKPRLTLQNLCINYCDEVASKEWPAMKHDEASSEVGDIYTKINDAIITLHPTNVGQETIQRAMVTSLSNLGQNRERRLVAVHSKWMRQLLPLLVMCVIILMAFCYLYLKREKEAFLVHAILVCFVAITLGTNVGVIVLLNRPFSGDWTIEPEGIELTSKALKGHLNKPLISE
jgi:hypothetical protein